MPATKPLGEWKCLSSFGCSAYRWASSSCCGFCTSSDASFHETAKARARGLLLFLFSGRQFSKPSDYCATPIRRSASIACDNPGSSDAARRRSAMAASRAPSFSWISPRRLKAAAEFSLSAAAFSASASASVNLPARYCACVVPVNAPCPPRARSGAHAEGARGGSIALDARP